ncbi:hypothetical protein [Desulfovibrio sp. JC022]|uniref:hypothetical protein n=1 Tax=Desulfovibrio sp. JC022 TaxID=2593642 RepID=UPI0013D45CF8|nr:hypothetical protein [Desulfovibrio sp. JC022]NDV24620.1 hypothetical protein [Desulfovibrio sp. JC022]
MSIINRLNQLIDKGQGDFVNCVTISNIKRTSRLVAVCANRLIRINIYCDITPVALGELGGDSLEEFFWKVSFISSSHLLSYCMKVARTDRFVWVKDVLPMIFCTGWKVLF